MDNTPLVDQLRGYARRGVSFAVARDALGQAGWSQAEIEAAAEQFPYDLVQHGADVDGDANSSSEAAAMALGVAALNDQRSDARDVAIADGLDGGMGPDLQSQSYYESKFYDDIGIPWYVWIGVQFGIGALAYVLNLPGWVTVVAVVWLAAYTLYKAYQRFH
ncbi:hypothetical protein HJC99_01025 [Candidatus Saccharibacteria bacterium]|nr:hypothetical protein [Candidatus Saccharibacteria bacterium]